MNATGLFDGAGAAAPALRYEDRYGFRVWARWLGRCKGCGCGLRVEWHEGDTHEGETIFPTMRKPCGGCGGWVEVEAVTGERNDRVKCGARCVNAIGPSCECSCGGENHGRNGR